MSLSDKSRMDLLEHAVWMHNAGIDHAPVLKIAQVLADWCERAPAVDKAVYVTGGMHGFTIPPRPCDNSEGAE